MNMSMYAASVEIYRQMLGNLLTWLDRAEAHAKAKGFETGVYLTMRLAPDMLPFTAQVMIACEVAKIGVARLTGTEPPTWTGDLKSLDDLRARVRLAIDHLASVDAHQVETGVARQVTVPQRGAEPLHFNGTDFLVHYSLPNFFFHVTTSYALLRQAGVDVGKSDFLARAPAR